MDHLESGSNEEMINFLSVHGCTLLVLDLPLNWVFGCDMMFWQTGNMFRGVNGIPAGVHYVYISASEDSPRQGVFVSFPADSKDSMDRIKVLRFCTSREQLVPLADYEEEKRFKLGVTRFDFVKYLGRYPVETWPSWKEVTHCLSSELLDKLQPSIEPYRDSKVMDESPGTLSEEGSEGSRENQEGQQEEVDSCTLVWSDIPSVAIVGMEPSLVSKAYMDKSPCLDALLVSRKNTPAPSGKEVPSIPPAELHFLGEVQAAFISFFLGHNYSAFEHWKKLLVLLSECPSSCMPQSHGSLFIEAVRVIYAQLQQAPPELLSQEPIGPHASLKSDNFLASVCKSLVEFSKESGMKKLQSRCSHLQALLEKRFDVHFGEEEDEMEDRPVVVPCTSSNDLDHEQTLSFEDLLKSSGGVRLQTHS